MEFTDYSSAIYKVTWARPLNLTTEIKNNGVIRIEFDTSTGFIYNLNSSQELVTLQADKSVQGNGERLSFEISTNEVAGNSSEFFWLDAD